MFVCFNIKGIDGAGYIACRHMRIFVRTGEINMKIHSNRKSEIVSVATLVPGQLGWVFSGNKFHEGAYVVGANYQYFIMKHQEDRVYAVNLLNGIPITDPDTLVITFPTDIELELKHKAD